jgi:hypothetical protein
MIERQTDRWTNIQTQTRTFTKLIETDRGKAREVTGRQADRQTGRQADRQTGRHADSQTGRQADRLTN